MKKLGIIRHPYIFATISLFMSNSLARRFQLIVDQLSSGNKKAFAELTGKSASHIYKICRGSSRPSMAYVQHLYDEFRIDLNWLLTGDQAEGATGEMSGLSSKADDLVYAPMFDVHASAGFGAEVVAEDISDYFAFNKHWLSRQLGVSSQQLVFVSIRGDSMEPTLFDGDNVLVDMSKKNVSSHSLYLLQTEQGLMAKRLKQQGEHQLEVISDNEQYQDWLLDLSALEFNPVVGKIVWCARAL